MRLFDLALVNLLWLCPNRANSRELRAGTGSSYTRAGQCPGRRRPVSHGPRFPGPTWLPVRFGGAKKTTRSQRALAPRIRPRDPMRYFRHGSRSRPNTDPVIKLALVMLALGGQETARRAFLRIQISLEPGSVLVAAGIVDRRWCLPNPSSGIPTVEAELPIEAFIPPYLGRAI
jgi:hypothetical protein